MEFKKPRSGTSNIGKYSIYRDGVFPRFHPAFPQRGTLFWFRIGPGLLSRIPRNYSGIPWSVAMAISEKEVFIFKDIVSVAFFPVMSSSFSSFKYFTLSVRNI